MPGPECLFHAIMEIRKVLLFFFLNPDRTACHNARVHKAKADTKNLCSRSYFNAGAAYPVFHCEKALVNE